MKSLLKIKKIINKVKHFLSKKSNLILTIIILFIALLAWSNNQQTKELKKENDYLERSLEKYKTALSEANENIEQANDYLEELSSRINWARKYAWESYDEMGEALENLSGQSYGLYGWSTYSVDTVDEPYVPSRKQKGIRVL